MLPESSQPTANLPLASGCNSSANWFQDHTYTPYPVRTDSWAWFGDGSDGSSSLSLTPMPTVTKDLGR